MADILCDMSHSLREPAWISNLRIEVENTIAVYREADEVVALHFGVDLDQLATSVRRAPLVQYWPRREVSGADLQAAAQMERAAGSLVI